MPERVDDHKGLRFDAMWRMEPVYQRVGELLWQAAMSRMQGDPRRAHEYEFAANEVRATLERLEHSLSNMSVRTTTETAPQLPQEGSTE